MNIATKVTPNISATKDVSLEDKYVSDNKYILDNGDKCLNVTELEDGKYIDKQLKKVIDDNNIKAFNVKISDARVESFDIKTIVCGQAPDTAPHMTLKGTDPWIIELGSTGSNPDQGFEVSGLQTGDTFSKYIKYYDKDNNVIYEETSEDNAATTNITSTWALASTKNTLSTSSLTTYLAEYRVVAKDSNNDVIFDETLHRRIRVADTTAPVIIVNDEYKNIITLDTTYNLNNLFTIQDISPVTTKITTNLTLGVRGKYKVTITATDRSGNKSTKTVYVTVTNDTGATFVQAGPTDTHKGIVYINPVNPSVVCNAENSTPKIERGHSYGPNDSGCMKFYIYDDDGDTYKMILNINILNVCAGTNVEGNVIMYTPGWYGNPRNITANEVAHIVGADRQDTLKWDVSKTYAGDPTDLDTQKGWIYLDGSGNTYSGWQTAVANSENLSRYYWLYDYTYVCAANGCQTELEYFPNGYWTPDFDWPSCWKMSGSCLWGVSKEGKLVGQSESSSFTEFGIRPVIELPKELFE